MNKILIPLFIIVSLFIGYPMAEVSAATTTASKTTVSTSKPTTTKTVTKKKVVKTVVKKKKKKKERLIPAPALFTLSNAPHSPKVIAKAKKKTPTKVVAKKKV